MSATRAATSSVTSSVTDSVVASHALHGVDSAEGSADSSADSSADVLARLAQIIESRKAANGGDPQTSYVARLLHKGSDAFLKKIGEEATEVVMAAKDADYGGDAGKIVAEVADLWFHCLIALAHYELHPQQVLAELARREGMSGIEEKALRKALVRENTERRDQP